MGKALVVGHQNPTYAGMIYAVDRSVGRITKLLDELKIAENTVVIFSSDNGGVGGHSRPDGLIHDADFENKPMGKDKKNNANPGGPIDKEDYRKDITDNAPLRSGKGSLYEGGTRDPLIVRWPGVVTPGTNCEAPIIHVDVYPTLLEIAKNSSRNKLIQNDYCGLMV